MAAALPPAGPLATGWCQRSTARGGQTWRHASEGGFDRRRYEAAPIDEETARAWITRRHYSGTYPAARLRYGMFDLHADRPALVGVAVLSVPMQRATLTNAFPGLEPYAQSLELGRFCLADEVPANGESWFIARILEAAAQEGVRGLVSFADPFPRPRADGTVVFPGHLGIIYQASGWSYTGRSTPRTLSLLRDGSVFSPRAAAKIRGGEQGHRYAAQQLLRHGAPAPGEGESGAQWLARALDHIGARPMRHPGNHRYLARLGRTRAERTATTIALASRPYPKETRTP